MTASDVSGNGDGSPERSVADVAMDLFVYAPAGVVITAATDLPAMAAKGRARIEQELRNAHVLGRFVVDTGLRQVRGQLDALLGRSGEPAPVPEPGPVVTPPVRRRAGSEPADTGASTRDPAVDRAIPGYDTLSASQVVRRLDGLERRELRAVVRHELANRGRRTILHRAEQLLGDVPPGPPPAAV